MKLLLLFAVLLIFLIIFKYVQGLDWEPLAYHRHVPYHKKKYFFSRSEQSFFNILNAHLDAQRYTIFPKVRLVDFIEVDRDDFSDRLWWNKIQRKHVDFLIWDLVERKIVLAIELDGNSHNSERMRERDEFVNDVYEKVGITLERVKVGKNFEGECERIVGMVNGG